MYSGRNDSGPLLSCHNKTMLVTRKCHNCGKKNRFDKSKIQGTLRCKRCGRGIRRTEADMGLLKALWISFTGYIFYNKAAFLSAALLIAAVVGGSFYWNKLASQKEEVVNETPPPIKLRTKSEIASTEPGDVSDVTATAVAKPLLKRDPKRFEAAPLWSELPALNEVPMQTTSNLIAVSGSPTRYIAASNNVYDLKSGEVIAEFPTDEATLRVAISHDGTRLATATSNEKQEVRIAITSVASPDTSPIQISPGCRPLGLGIVAFTPSGQIVVQTKTVVGSTITVWSPDGSDVARFETPLFNAEAFALAPHKNQLAIATVLAVEIYDLTTGRQVATMAPAETGFPVSMCGGLAFSPDGTEIAAIVHQDRFLVWNTTDGSLALNHILERSVTQKTGLGPGLQWLPNGRGWFINGTQLLLDDPLSIVWEAAEPSTRRHGYVVDHNHILASEQENGSRLVPIKLPWTTIDSLDSILSKSLVGEGTQIQVQVLEKGKDTNQQPRFTDALEDRCRALGLDVSNDAPVRLLMEYSEKQGNRKPYKNGEYLDPIGRVIYPTEINCTFKLTRRDNSKTLWSKSISKDGGFKPEIVMSAEHIRQQAIMSVVNDIGTLNIPSIILDDPDSRLPIRRAPAGVE